MCTSKAPLKMMFPRTQHSTITLLVLVALGSFSDAHRIAAKAGKEKLVSPTQWQGRKLQLGTGLLDRYQVGESTIDFNGMEIEFRYPLSDLVPDNSVVITTYSDSDCSIDISANNYLVPEITYDDNPNPSGEKNREVTVVYTIEPFEIKGKDVWVDNDDGTVLLNFCSAINLYTGDISDPSSGPYSRLDTLVSLQVDFEGGLEAELPVGPNDIRRENAQEIYTVEGFICDEANTLLNSEKPMVQGEKVRVCVKPTDEALADGIFMRRVDSFTFYRNKEDGTQVTQTALRDGRSANEELTELTCPRGSTVCWFETILKADFYFKAGMILGYGEAWLQFGSGSSRRLEVGMRSLVDVSGGFANTASIELSFFAVPGGNEYLAEAYHCDQYNRRLEVQPALYVGQSARICVAPTEEGREVGIRVHSIDSFNFTRSFDMQSAVIENAGSADGQSVVVCKPNSEVCAFRTILQNSFFTSDGLVGADGMVTLQYSENSGHTSRRLQQARSSSPATARSLQAGSSLFIAGQSPVNVDTLVLYQRDDELNPCSFEHEFTEWWIQEDMQDRYKYIATLAIIAALLALCLFCCWCIPPFFFRRRRKTVQEKGNDVHVNVEVKKENETTNMVQSAEEVVPGPNDVVFGEKARPMTAKFLKNVRTVARDNILKEYGPSIYKACKKPFDECGFYSMDVEGKYKRLTPEETVGMIGKAFAEAKMQLEETSIAKTPRSMSYGNITALTEPTNSNSTARTRQLRRINSSGDLVEYPDKNDIVLGDQNHPGTRSFLRHVRKVAREYRDEEFNASIYREIKKVFHGCDVFVSGSDGTYKRPKKTEICALAGEAFEEAKMANSRSVAPSVRGSIEFNKNEAEDDLSSMGESLYRPWAEDDRTSRKSRGSKETRRSSRRESPTLSLNSYSGSKQDPPGVGRSTHRRSRSLTDLHDNCEADDVTAKRSKRSSKQRGDDGMASIKSRQRSTGSKSSTESSSSPSSKSRRSRRSQGIETTGSRRRSMR